MSSKPEVHFKNFEKVERLIRKATQVFNEQISLVDPSKPAPDPKLLEILARFGSYRSAVAQLLKFLDPARFEALLEQNSDTEPDFVPWAVLQTTDEDDEDTVVLLVSDEGDDGWRGIYYDGNDDALELEWDPTESSLTPATSEQIVTFLQLLQEQGLDDDQLTKKLNRDSRMIEG